MKKSQFTEAQIVAVLHEWTAGAKVADLIRRHGVTEQTLSRWRKKYGGLQVSEMKRLRALEDENRQLKRLVAGQMARQMVTFASSSSEQGENAMTHVSVKQRALEAVATLPEDATFEDAMERLYFLAKVEKGLAQADTGELIPHGEVEARFTSEAR